MGKKRRHDSSDSSDSSDSDSDDSEIEKKKKKKRRRRRSKKDRDDPSDAKKSSKKPYDKNYIPGESSKSKCQICFIEKAKYRCPKCRILYCVDEKAEFKCFREHKEKGTCEERIAKGMDIKEKLAIALKERKRKMKELGIIK